MGLLGNEGRVLAAFIGEGPAKVESYPVVENGAPIGYVCKITPIGPPLGAAKWVVLPVARMIHPTEEATEAAAVAKLVGMARRGRPS